jgi:hypothetical protein
LWGPVALAVFAAACADSPSISGERRLAALAWGGEQKLLASDAAELDQFGWSVSLAADRALVGAHGESGGRGAAYVYVENGATWIQEQKLAARDGAELDKFGSSVSLGADRILVGAYGAASFRGAAYVFVRSGGVWVEEQKLVARDGAAGANFGHAVALAGDRALVGAYGSGGARGAAYVFVRSGGVWVEEQKLVAPDGAADDIFGWSVALAGAGDRTLVGAPGRAGARGAAHVFVFSDNAWTEEQELVANDGVAFDNFGQAVSLSGDRALVGAHWNDDFRGAAYVFVRGASSWTAEQKLVVGAGAPSRFGNAVSLAGDRALIGAYAAEDGRGAAYVFSRDADVWTEEQRLLAGEVQADLYAWSVSLAGDRALVGANYNDQLRGAAYLYSLGAESRDAGAADAAADADVGSDGSPGPGACTRGDECASGHCEDGICCDRTCAPSERCRAELKISGEDGICGPAIAAAPGAACRFDVQCTSGLCAGGACASGIGGDAPGGGGDSCGCRAGRAPRHGPQTWVLLALPALCRRRRPGAR